MASPELESQARSPRSGDTVVLTIDACGYRARETGFQVIYRANGQVRLGALTCFGVSRFHFSVPEEYVALAGASA